MRQRRRAMLGSALFAVALVVLVAAAIFFRPPQFHPYVVFNATESLQIALLKKSHVSRAHCEAAIGRMARALEAYPAFRSVENRCIDQLDARQRKILYGQPVDVPVMRIPDGAVAFIGSAAELAFLSCQEGVRQTARIVAGRTECASPGIENLALSVAKLSGNGASPAPKFASLLGIILLAAAMAFLVCYVLIRSERLHKRFSHDGTETGPQKFHATPTVRIGGLAIACALIGTILVIGALGWLRSTAVEGLYLLALAAIPAFAGGLGEDLTKRVGVFARLMLTIAAGVIAALLVQATLDRVDVPGLDALLQWPIFAIAFTAIAVGGMANGINIIDGYHGLAAGYSVIVLAAIAFVAAQVGDAVVLSASLAMLGALLGFLIWNYPKGKIFLGDGGAYLLGFWLAELSVLLVVRNSEVSPWFPMLLLAYPVFETLFSFYRKKLFHGISPGRPDGFHLHMLIYKRIARVAVETKKRIDSAHRHSMVARYIWAATSVFILPSLFFWRNSTVLIALVLLFCAAYVYLYLRLTQAYARDYSPKEALQQKTC
jgi:UDP-GlcNAc:undecaprenyl-phosphate/decaprenyl-phosphate GlcNAc-1-phosphate transferase